MPSRSKTGSSSSIRRQNWASLAGRLGPAVELGVHHGDAEVAAIWIARFQ